MTIVSNTLDGDDLVGAGIYVNKSRLNLTRSTVGWNRNCGPNGGGGGLGTLGMAVLQVRDSTLLDNQAGSGGGVCDPGFLTTASISITNSTLYGNLAATDGGGVDASQAGLYNVTVSHNVADSDNNGTGDGGGFFIGGLGQLTLANSLVSGNVDIGGQAPNCAGSGGIQSLGYNLIQSLDGCSITGNFMSNDPLLGPLADNGGPTLTAALPANSPAVNHGNPAGCRDGAGVLLTTDQRGLPRWLPCDLGAFEFQPRLLFLPLVQH